MLIINELKCAIDSDEKAIKQKLCQKLKIKADELLSFEITKRSIDARKNLVYVYQIIFTAKNEKYLLNKPGIQRYQKPDISVTKVKSDKRPIIIGYGPSGIFAAYRLKQAGLNPIVFEKGGRIPQRVADVENFFKTGKLNPDSNIQFGEGGAGTFSDAKLTTRIKNPFIDYILDVFVQNGAKASIKIDAHPHIGTDEIRKVIKAITDYLIAEGVEFHFNEAVKEILIKDGQVQGVKTSKQTYLSPIVVLATGHSAYDIAKNLKQNNVAMTSKDLAIGFRVEHPQSLIDEHQYHNADYVEVLGHAEYFLRHQSKRGVYSFCMCPGGIVVPACSEENTIVTNGMSYANRGSGIANSAILAQVSKDEFGDDVLGGFDFLKTLEKQAYRITNSYKAPAMNIKDYLNDKLNPLIFKSSYPLATHLYNLNHFFSKEYNDAFKVALMAFDQKIPGFIDQGIMVAPETRSSSPIRVLRKEDGQSENTNGLYPCGEGSGYGGGIMSCAIDGIRIADKILKKLS